MSRVGETGAGKRGIGETGVGEMGVDETGPNRNHLASEGCQFWIEVSGSQGLCP